MKMNLFTKTGTKSEKEINLPEEIFGIEVNESILNKAIRIFLANQRQSNAHSKTRGDVRGGGKKPWRQKGTGRARSGSIRNPIFTGGGVAFGPKNEANHKLHMNRKEKQLAIRSAFSAHMKKKSISIFEDFSFKGEKLTQSLVKSLEKAQVSGKTLIIQDKLNPELTNAAANVKEVDTEVINSINAYKLLKYKNIVLLPQTVDKIIEFWGKKKEVIKLKK